MSGSLSESPLRGRDDEVEHVAVLLDAVEERGAALVVRGAAGIGKSALLAEARRRAQLRGMRVLTTTGVELEAELAFAGLHQLVQPLLARAEVLPGPQRAALEAAFGITNEAAPDLFLIGLATLELLGEAATASPLLLVAEDAHWLDQPSRDVLAFIARRISAEPIVLLIAVREDRDAPFESAALPDLVLEPLAPEAAAELLDAHAPGLPYPVRAQVLEVASGNPLALVELPTTLRLAPAATPGGPATLPLTTRLERAFAARGSELPDATQVSLLVAAADGGSGLEEVLRSAAMVLGRPVDSATLQPALAAKLIELDGGHVRFPHPLVRSAIYQAASGTRRLATHAALAKVLAAQPDRSVWHRAAASLGRDADVASSLDAAAARARRRGAVSVAVAALQRAAELSDGAGQSARRLLEAAKLGVELGRRDVVVRAVDRVDPSDVSALDRVRMTWLRAMIDPGPPEGPATIHALVDDAERAWAGRDRKLALDLLWLAASRCWWSDPGAETRARLVAVVDGLGADDPRVAAMLAYAAPLERGGDVIERLSVSRPDRGDPDAAQLLGSAGIATGAWDLASAFLAASASGLRANGQLGHLPRVLVLQATIAVRMGERSTSVPATDEARTLALETGQPLWQVSANAVDALAAGIQGDEGMAEALAAQVESVALPLGGAILLAGVQLARGATALAGGRHGHAYEQLRRVFTSGDPAYHWMLRWWGLADLAEAAVHCGEGDAARALAGELEALTAPTPAFWFGVQLRHARAVLADDDTAEPLFRRAIDADLGRWPYQRARLQLAYGEWLRRRRRVAEARPPMRTARDTFHAVGAASWAERALRELRASGERSRPRTRETQDELTPQELQIAQLAAEGLTNREIGQQLFLSHRTVGSHLHRLFPKLGITSRTQLTRALDGSAVTR